MTESAGETRMIRSAASLGETIHSVRSSVCVIGSGIAGLVAAMKLVEGGRHVVILESGSLNKGRYAESIDDVGLGESPYRRAVSGRSRGLGGTSALWGGCLLPLASSDFDARPHLGLAGWPLKRSDLDRFLVEIERLLDIDHSSYEHEPLDREVHTQGDDAACGLVKRRPKFPLLRKMNFATLFRHFLKSNEKVEIWFDATVAAIVCDTASGRVSAVRTTCASGRGLLVQADDFILACGTFETTRLLLSLNRGTDERAFSGCEAIGRYFHDHLAVEIGRGATVSALAFRPDVRLRTRRGLHLETALSAQVADRTASGYVTACYLPPDDHWLSNARDLTVNGQSRILSSVKNLRDRFEQACPRFYWACYVAGIERSKRIDLSLQARIEQVPDSSCRLTLSARMGPLGMPLLKLNWRKGQSEERAFRSVFGRVKAFWNFHGLDQSMPMRWVSETYDDHRQPFCENSIDTSHPAGTARMGLSPSNSVVGPDLRCHAVPNLLVASAAVFPSSGSANPTLTIMQLAMLAAESILRA